MNSSIKRDTVFGLHKCTLTGKFSVDNVYAEIVHHYGITTFAKIAFSGFVFSAPSKELVSKYSTQIEGLIIYLEGSVDKPYLVGLSVRDTSDKSLLKDLESFPSSTVLLTENFKIGLDDAKKEAGVYFKTGNFKLGDRDSQQPMTLGKTLVDTLKDILTTQNKIIQAIINYQGISPTGAVVTNPALNPELLTIPQEILRIDANLSKILSSSNSLS